VATVFREPLFSNKARSPNRSAGFIGQNLLLTTLAVAVTVTPFNQTSWPNQQKRQQQNVGFIGQNLLLTTLAPVVTPFVQELWSQPVKKVSQNSGYVGQGLLQTTLAPAAPAAVPTAQQQWLNPTKQSGKQVGFVGQNLLETTLAVAPATPFAQQQWPAIKKANNLNVGFVGPNLLQTTLSVPVANYGLRPDIQKLTTTALLEFFVIDLSPIGVDAKYYFHNDVNELRNDVSWQGQVYTRFPIEADGFEWNGSGAQPRPKVRVGNITGLLGALAREHQDLVGVKFTRKRTFLRYLDAVNFASGNPTADPNIHFTDEIWYIDRKTSENRVFLEWELASGADLTGVLLPRRQCIQNTCTWQYRSAECGYSGPPVADINDQPTSDSALDACSKRLTGCDYRYPEPTPKPFGGFPAIGKLR
jgi:lambda family phage minor tail protein L